MRQILIGALCALAAIVAGTRQSAAQELAEPADLWLGVRALACDQDARGVDATFFVPPLSDGARQHKGIPGTPDQIWIDLSLFNNGYAPGTFLGNGPYASTIHFQAITWKGLRPGTAHYYRINARVGGQWHEVTRGLFETPDCTDIMGTVCGEVGVDVTFLVRRPSITEHGAPIETWLDLTLRADGFAPGTFLGAGPFVSAPGVEHPFGTLFVWRGLRILERHYWRTNTLFQPFGWIVQRRGSFRPHDCNTLLSIAD